MTRLWAAAVAAITTSLLATFVIPAAAWAEQSGVADVLQRRPRGIGFGFASVLCCLVVVGGIVVVVLMLSRRRR